MNEGWADHPIDVGHRDSPRLIERIGDILAFFVGAVLTTSGRQPAMAAYPLRTFASFGAVHPMTHAHDRNSASHGIPHCLAAAVRPEAASRGGCTRSCRRTTGKGFARTSTGANRVVLRRSVAHPTRFERVASTFGG
jgi:hypothetical protein